jgi:hypothetical protein
MFQCLRIKLHIIYHSNVPSVVLCSGLYKQQVTQTMIDIKHGKCMLGIDWACTLFSKSPGHDVQINGKNYIFWLLQFRILA